MPKTKSKRKRYGSTIAYTVLIILTFWAVFPVFWLILNSVKPAEVMYTNPYTPLFIPSLEAYRFTLNYPTFLNGLKNSLIVSLSTTAITIFLAATGAYAITRRLFPGHRILHKGVLIAYVFPPIVLAVPLSVLMNKYGLIGTYQGLIVTYLTIVFPYCLWLLTGFFQSIPRELDGAAAIDGASRAVFFFRILLPLSSPGIITAAAFSFLGTWNHFLYAFLIGGRNQPLPAALRQVVASLKYEYPLNRIFAFAILTAAPAVFFFYLVQGQFVKGLARGAIKG